MTHIKVIGVFIIGLLIMVFSQGIGALWEEILPNFGLGNILFGLTYISVAYVLIRLWVRRGLKSTLNNYRITKVKIDRPVLILALLLPLCVYTFYFLFIPGEFFVDLSQSPNDIINQISFTLFVNALAAAIVEEFVLRGVLMGYIESQFNIQIAIVTTAIFFATIHLLNGVSSAVDILRLLISGTLVGVMFGLLTFIFKSVWASITVHLFWNLFQLISLTTDLSRSEFLQYRMNVHDLWITGGQYGIETSIISIMGYLVMIVLLLGIFFKFNKFNTR
ncbi:CPBP family intramembrane metalloprotease [Staphylococcus hyicus]|uniref:CPBP family intramembrane metalloprotease n=1 Tax=Staphylococcus hyicus TaxID=1284 RepID=A0A418JHX5_STAHY|nr:type II CAAX endopeptidase family protein [Staphylococcus hyicus]MCQ9291520.1 CPBP family intramembrane metalloprotease [Staphylococcus hyicus]MCQ9306761.1 CPBP family intramembrane metalloprotease [Staphylococcus hyicus]MCQ9309600.1 CPBP family intramembrane metalloprotease [Staphylococcus hyicus]MCQ9311595.1 CPBP family intramembrane metalloprotease [Staphylococcus hyicus]NJH80746.1 CPBP family intramembrane metalloprotease [Staphylococcus hyicus]